MVPKTSRRGKTQWVLGAGHVRSEGPGLGLCSADCSEVTRLFSTRPCLLKRQFPRTISLDSPPAVRTNSFAGNPFPTRRTGIDPPGNLISAHPKKGSDTGRLMGAPFFAFFVLFFDIFCRRG